MVRNGVLCSLALFIFPMINQQSLPAETDGIWLIVILGKEVLIGLLIGFVAAIPFWAIEAAGFLVDNQRGAAMASMFNPTLGSQSTPTAVLLTQTLITLFFSGGGFVTFIYALFKSYTSWPIVDFFPTVSDAWVSFFYAQFEQLMWLGVLMSAPLVLAMFLAEFGLRWCQQSCQNRSGRFEWSRAKSSGWMAGARQCRGGLCHRPRRGCACQTHAEP